MRGKIEVGRTYQSQTRVEEWMTAEKAGNRGVDVLSTPMLVQLVEEAAMQCVAPLLDDDEVTLGTHIDLAHLSATPVGLIVRTEVEVLKVEGRRVEYAFTAFDEREKIAEGTHERYVTSREAFRERLEEKFKARGAGDRAVAIERSRALLRLRTCLEQLSCPSAREPEGNRGNRAALSGSEAMRRAASVIHGPETWVGPKRLSKQVFLALPPCPGPAHAGATALHSTTP